MHLGFLHGKPIVAYKSVAEAISVRSCLTCKRYRDNIPCPFYGDCRAERQKEDIPTFYVQASDELIESRLTTVEGEITWI